MTIQIVRPHHRSASAVGPIHDSFFRNVNPLSIDAHAIVTILAFPICIVDALCLTAIAARTLATVQGLIPTVQLGVIPIMRTNATDCEGRQGNRSKHHHRVPIFGHFTSNSSCDRLAPPSQAPLSADLSKIACSHLSAISPKQIENRCEAPPDNEMPIVMYHVVESREAAQERRPVQRHRSRSPCLENFAGPRDDFITLEIFEPWWGHQRLLLGGVSYIGGVGIRPRSGTRSLVLTRTGPHFAGKRYGTRAQNKAAPTRGLTRR